MAGEICPNTGDMTNCYKKPRCRWGGCEGQSLPSSGENCPDGYTFREEYCDCEPTDCGPVCTLFLSYKIVYRSYTGANCSQTTTTCSAFGGNFLTQQVTNVIQGTSFEFIGVLNTGGPLGSCNGKVSESAGVRVTRCVNGVPTVQEVFLGSGGCSINTSAGQELIEVIDNNSYIGSCTVNIETTSRVYNNTYDCFDCSGGLTNQSIGGDTTNVTSTTVADYETAYIDCTGNNACESSCLWRTNNNVLWRDAGWINVVNCDAAGTPDSGQNFICPDNVSQPCNAFENQSLRYYSGSGRLYDAPRLVGS